MMNGSDANELWAGVFPHESELFSVLGGDWSEIW